MRVLFEAANVVVVDKPSGQLVHNSTFAGPREHTLTTDVRAALGDDWSPVHRLDRQASGCVLFARGADAVARWQAALARDDAEKRYLALVRGHLTVALDVDHPLKDADDERAEPLRREARTRVVAIVVSSEDRCSLVEARPFTGRMHQVRRHLKHVDHPILGDANYGKGALNRAFKERWGLARLALHCFAVAAHDADGTAVRALAPIPDDLAAPLTRLFPALDVGALPFRQA